MPALFRLFSILPLWFLHALGAVLGWLVFAASPTYRRRFLENIQGAGYPFSQVRAGVGHAGRMVCELPRLWLGQSPPCTIEGAQCVEDAWQAGRGIVFLTPHLGCFEMSVQAAAARWSGEHGPITVLYRPARQSWLAQVMRTARNRPGVQAVPTDLSGVRQMLKALRRGQAVGLLPDQVPPEGQGLWVPFFGRPAYTMTLAARLAQQSGAAIILVHCIRLPAGGGYVAHFRPFEDVLAQDLASDLAQAVGQINAAIEDTIAQCPQQYLWGYGRYKIPRSEPAPPTLNEGQS